jgi:uncharacterized membrane protein YoaK (UPF0700 family)
MGVLNTTVSHVGGQSVNLGLSNIGQHLARLARRMPLIDSRTEWDTRGVGVSTLLAVWGSFLIGAAFAGARCDSPIHGCLSHRF